jgi:hypothetical protein
MSEPGEVWESIRRVSPRPGVEDLCAQLHAETAIALQIVRVGQHHQSAAGR